MLIKKQAILLVLVFFATALVEAKEYQPEFPVAYRPEAKTDEGGFWHRVETIEAQVRVSPFLERDEAINQHLRKMVCEIAADYCGDIRVYVIKDPHFNASMYPNGMMHVYTGLLSRVRDDDELAAVLAHEIAHYLLAHQIEQYRRARKMLGITAFLDLALGGWSTIAAALTLGSYSRGSESDADLYGLELMHDAGYGAESAPELWKYLQKERKADKTKTKGLSFFSTHPAVPKRIKTLTQKISELPPAERSEPLLQRRIHSLIRPLYTQIMDAHVATREVEQIDLILSRHEEIGYPKHLIAFYRGEMFRFRAQAGDAKRAREQYQLALSYEQEQPKAHRELAYLAMKMKDYKKAHTHFMQYKFFSPAADDVAMTDYYIDILEKKQ